MGAKKSGGIVFEFPLVKNLNSKIHPLNFEV